MRFTEPELYSKYFSDLQKEANRLMDVYGQFVEWGPNDAILNVGCGTGDEINDVLLPRIPPTFTKLVGIDISQDMIKYAKKKWNVEKLSFEVMDIAAPSIPPALEEGSFDKVVSIFCLHRVKDRNQLARNIFAFLKPGGQAFLVLATKNETFPAWDMIAKTDKWKPYLKAAELPVNEYQYMKYPDLVFKEALEKAGLVVEESHLTMRRGAFRFRDESDQVFMLRMKGFDPYLLYIPEDLHEDYLRDLMAVFKNKEPEDGDYECLIISARKPTNAN